MQPISVLATLTGRDRPGVTAALFAALAAHDVDVRDVEQVVVRERMMLAVLLDLQGELQALRASVTQAARALGMECEVVVADAGKPPPRAHRRARSHVMVFGRPLRSGALSIVAQRIGDLGANIESIAQLATEPVSAVELIVSSGDAVELRAALVQAAQDAGVDIAVEPTALRLRAKRLVMLDLDSTLMRGNGIDVLAERAGMGDRVREIAARARAGELDTTESIRQQVALLEGVPLHEVCAARDALRLEAGAEGGVRALRRLGYRVGIVSAGCTVFAERFVRELELDFAAANELETSGGVLTGRLVGDVVDASGRARALARFAEQCGVPLSQSVAVGSGTHDIEMIQAAGLSIAFNTSAALRAADPAAPAPYLDSVLFALGITADDLAEAGD